LGGFGWGLGGHVYCERGWCVWWCVCVCVWKGARGDQDAVELPFFSACECVVATYFWVVAGARADCCIVRTYGGGGIVNCVVCAFSFFVDLQPCNLSTYVNRSM
jgi:hypothetical protein